MYICYIFMLYVFLMFLEMMYYCNEMASAYNKISESESVTEEKWLRLTSEIAGLPAWN